MGFRLAGPLLEHKSDYNIVSDGIVAGSIQVPGSKLPIVLMADAQTTGGYPKIATVISADLPVLAVRGAWPQRQISIGVARGRRDDSPGRASTTSENHIGHTSCKRIPRHPSRSLVQSEPDRRRHRRERLTPSSLARICLSVKAPHRDLAITLDCSIALRLSYIPSKHANCPTPQRVDRSPQHGFLSPPHILESVRRRMKLVHRGLQIETVVLPCAQWPSSGRACHRCDDLSGPTLRWARWFRRIACGLVSLPALTD